MSVIPVLLLVVFVGLLLWGRSQIAHNLGAEVAGGAVALVLATVLGCLLMLILYGETV